MSKIVIKKTLSWSLITIISIQCSLNAQNFDRDILPDLKITYTSASLLKATGYVYDEGKNIWRSHRRQISKLPWYYDDYNVNNNFRWAKVFLIQANNEKRVVLLFKIRDYYWKYPNLKVEKRYTWKYKYINVSTTTFSEFNRWLKSERESRFILGSAERCGSFGNESGNRHTSLKELYTDINKSNLKIPSKNYWSDYNHGDYGSKIIFYKKNGKVRFNLPSSVLEIFGEPYFGEDSYESGPSSYFECDQNYLIRIFSLNK